MANEKSQSGRSAVIIGVLIVLSAGLAIKVVVDHREKQAVTAALTEKSEALEETLARLGDIQAELNEKIATIEKLGGDVSELQKAKEEIQKELTRTRTRSAKAIAELKDRVEGYEELLNVKDKEIERLKEVNQELFSENRKLKTRENALNDSINRLAKNKQDLADKVSLASRLEAENITVAAVDSRGKERNSPFRARQLDKLKVDFDLARNDVAPIEGKKIMIRIIDETEQVIFDVSKGSGTFMLNGRETFYTAHQEILFDNTRQHLSFVYQKSSEFASGAYRVEIFTEGYLMGSFAFEVR